MEGQRTLTLPTPLPACTCPWEEIPVIDIRNSFPLDSLFFHYYYHFLLGEQTLLIAIFLWPLHHVLYKKKDCCGYFFYSGLRDLRQSSLINNLIHWLGDTNSIYPFNSDIITGVELNL